MNREEKSPIEVVVVLGIDAVLIVPYNNAFSTRARFIANTARLRRSSDVCVSGSICCTIRNNITLDDDDDDDELARLFVIG
jgi:hypothetical protein